MKKGRGGGKEKREGEYVLTVWEMKCEPTPTAAGPPGPSPSIHLGQLDCLSQ